MFEVTPAHSSYDWHNAPAEQYVLTLTGVLVFTTMSGETFTIVPGDVLLAEDLTGTGHEWQMVGDDLWRRAYVIFPRALTPSSFPV
jgi:quercetin dioxygenase-like cupin family protein